MGGSGGGGITGRARGPVVGLGWARQVGSVPAALEGSQDLRVGHHLEVVFHPLPAGWLVYHLLCWLGLHHPNHLQELDHQGVHVVHISSHCM